MIDGAYITTGYDQSRYVPFGLEMEKNPCLGSALLCDCFFVVPYYLSVGRVFQESLCKGSTVF